VSDTSAGTLSALLAEVAALLPLAAFDPTGLDLTPFEDRIVAFARDLLARAQSLQTEILRRLTAADASLTEYDAAVTAPDRVAAGLDALEALLGEDVLTVPEFTPPGPLATELRNARAASPALIQHLINAGRDFPADDWLHGVARVREVPRLWERILLLADALRGEGGLLGEPDRLPDPLLTPVQLPLRPNDHWLGMEFVPGTEITEDRLLYTAHYASDPPPSQPNRCGLLLDEWTEVIPETRETTAIAANLDRPDTEPAQAMLLVVPPVRTGTWSVDDLVAAVTETYELAQLRAVEPEHLDDTAYAHLLPATTMSATRRQITISTDLAIANLRWKTRD